MNKKFFEISSNIIYVEYYLELLDLKIFFHRVYVEKMKKEMKCLSSNVGLFFYHNRFLPGLALLILRHVLRIIELACLTRISVDLLEARFLYSYLRMSGVDLCSSTMALTSIVWLPLSWLAWFVMSVACFSVSSLSFLSR